MKKAYITPSTLVVEAEPESMVCASGEITVDVTFDTSDTTDGDDALSRHSSFWDDED